MSVLVIVDNELLPIKIHHRPSHPLLLSVPNIPHINAKVRWVRMRKHVA